MSNPPPPLHKGVRREESRYLLLYLLLLNYQDAFLFAFGGKNVQNDIRKPSSRSSSSTTFFHSPSSVGTIDVPSLFPQKAGGEGFFFQKKEEREGGKDKKDTQRVYFSQRKKEKKRTKNRFRAERYHIACGIVLKDCSV